MAVSKLKTSLPPLQIRNDFPKIPGIKIRGLPSHKVSTYFHEKKVLCTTKPPINEWLSYLLLNHVLFLNNSDNRVIFYQPISFCQVMFVSTLTLETTSDRRLILGYYRIEGACRKKEHAIVQKFLESQSTLKLFLDFFTIFEVQLK